MSVRPNFQIYNLPEGIRADFEIIPMGKRQVITCGLANAGKDVHFIKTAAICMPTDRFNAELGMEIAYGRAKKLYWQQQQTAQLVRNGKASPDILRTTDKYGLDPVTGQPISVGA